MFDFFWKSIDKERMFVYNIATNKRSEVQNEAKIYG